MSVFTQLLAGALATVRAVAGDPVSYTDGTYTCTPTAVVGKTTSDSTDDDGTTVTVKERDYLIAVADLVLNSVPIRPEPGHKITDQGAVYEVLPLAGRECYSYSDPDRTTYRIHTKQVPS